MLATTLVVVAMIAIAVASVMLLFPKFGKPPRRAGANAEVESMKAALERRIREGSELRF